MAAKTKNFILILFTTAITIACSNNRENNYDDFNTDLLTGNWKTYHLSDGLWENSLGLSFEDSICNYLLPNRGRSTYKIEGNEVIIGSAKQRNDYRFELIALDSNNLVLVPKGKTKEDLIDFFGKYKEPELLKRINGKVPSNVDTLYFERIQKKNKIKFSSISFFAGGCDGGKCHPLILKIKNNKSILLFNLENHKGYIGEVSDCQMQILNSLVQNIPINMIKQRYSAPWTNDQELSLNIKYAGNSINTIVYGFFDEPIELRMLIEELKSIKFLMNLKESNKVKRDSFVFEQIPVNIEEPI